MGVALAPSKIAKPRRCGMAVMLRNKGNHRKYMTIGALCGTWSCPTCGAFLKRKWSEHISSKLATLSRVFILILSNDSHWDTIHMRIRRTKGSYIVIKQQDGKLVVVSDMVVGGESVSVAEALSRLAQAIQNMTDRRPIHTSRSWALPKKNPELGAWERVSKLSVNVDEVEKIAKASGITVNSFFANHQMGFILELPENWIGGETRLLDLLASDGGLGKKA